MTKSKQLIKVYKNNTVRLLGLNILIIGFLFLLLIIISSLLLSKHTENSYRDMMIQTTERIDQQFGFIFNELHYLANQLQIDGRFTDESETRVALNNIINYTNLIDNGFVNSDEGIIKPEIEDKIKLDNVKNIDLLYTEDLILQRAKSIDYPNVLEFIVPYENQTTQLHFFIDIISNPTFLAFFDTLAFHDEHYIAIFDQDNHVFFEQNHLTMDDPFDYLTQIDLLFNKELNDINFNEFDDHNHSSYYITYQDIEHTDWKVILVVPKIISSAVSRELNAVLIPIFSIIALAIVILTTYISHRNAKPYNLLFNGISRISDGDYHHRIPRTNQNHYISTINTRFNIMAHQLEKYRDDVRRKTYELKQQKNFLDRIINNSPSLIYTMNYLGQYTMVNKQFADLYQLAPEEIIGKKETDINQDEKRAQYYAKLNRSIMMSGQIMATEDRQVNAAGEERWFHVNKQPINGEKADDLQLLCVATDITEMKRQADIIEYQANHDELTDLPNRKYFKYQIKHMLSDSAEDQKIALLFLDLDRFKYVNDTFGHEAGDNLLVSVSERLNQVVGDTGMVFRFGGDEFTVLTNFREDRTEVAELARNILTELTKPYNFEEHKFIVTASIGISLYPDHSQTVDDLTKFADMAMYLAKEQGKNTFRFYSKELETDISTSLRLEMDLYQAEERDELFVVYQPIFNATNHKLIGVEAVLRWAHTKLGLISTNEFIKTATDTGLIYRFVLNAFEEACQTIREWNNRGNDDLQLYVNFSERELCMEHFIESLTAIMQKTLIDPCLITIEVNEVIVTQNNRLVRKVLKRLKALGLSIAIDGFGTSYSSLTVLKSMPINQIKITNSFIDYMINDEDESTWKQLLKMKAKLNLSFIAENIETEEQLSFVNRDQWQGVQGFILCQPLTKEEFEQYY
ncbi:EAL domain-containing protein [Amphibacillus cookii]|uniref:EAL domain-containing protein n=1 Tax=Amphibacillus cookii TaxID=767787 RepID=UPI00195BFD05|nr:EAL domain-containing protein [Amphibacillus cookii]MBM7542593.1 diguanylate cyclase (GGDEF)-like protein/PAS domain S-box-containing protein [Amphibacillus cookii]